MFCNSVVVAFQCVVLAMSCKCVVAFLDPQLVELWMLQRSVRCVVWAAPLSALLSNWSIGQQCPAINPGSVPHSPPTPSLPLCANAFIEMQEKQFHLCIALLYGDEGGKGLDVVCCEFCLSFLLLNLTLTLRRDPWKEVLNPLLALSLMST